jgi:hypothetical protein
MVVMKLNIQRGCDEIVLNYLFAQLKETRGHILFVVS